MFTITYLLPGDPARAAADRYATPEQLEAVRQRLGLDQPFYVQYGRYLSRLLHLDLGLSMQSRQPVINDMRDFLPATFELMLAAMTITILVGIPLGVIGASSRSSVLKSVVRIVSVAGVGMPVFWSGLVLQLIFFGKLDWFPLNGRLSVGVAAPPQITGLYTVDALLAGQWSTYTDALWHLALPALALSFGTVAAVSRITYGSVIEVLQQDYIRTARSKGVTDRSILYRHALRNAFIPVLTTLGLQVGYLLAGAVLIENIFSWGGIGTYAWQAIIQLDTPIIMAVTLSTALVFVITNLVVDVLYTFVDPRIRYA
jgi:peptide/nickel transport system permease protein